MQFITVISTLALALPLAFAHPANNLEARYVRGWCGLHITQHQRNEYGVGPDYQYDLRIYDAAQNQIGGVNGFAIPNRQTRSVASQLPYTIDVTSGVDDRDPVGFAYAGQHWTTSSGQCRIGLYDSGKREGDCGFNC